MFEKSKSFFFKHFNLDNSSFLCFLFIVPLPLEFKHILYTQLGTPLTMKIAQ
jgi:hypothetical protein